MSRHFQLESNMTGAADVWCQLHQKQALVHI
jgi:hypothetical protein